MFKAWDKADPIDALERKRAKRIERMQGNVNKFEH
jgi:endonuclease I